MKLSNTYFKEFVKKHKVIVENLSYMSFLQIFLIVYPLITYPFLVKVLGMELYGLVLTSQMLASYASLFIDFGSNYVCAKHVSVNRNNPFKLSEILSNVLAVRLVVFIIVFFIYCIVVCLIPLYRNNYILFILMYGMTANELLFPQFFYQGIEQMKQITIISVGTKLLLIALIFIFIRNRNDILLVPVFYTLGALLGGIMSIYQIVYVLNIKFVRPSMQNSLFYFKDSLQIFATDFICAIKDRASYLILGGCLGLSDVVVYDLGLKLNSLLSKPYSILCTVLFPRIANTKSLEIIKKNMLISFLMTLAMAILANIFLYDIVLFFLHKECDLSPIRVFTLCPVILSASCVISNNLFVALGYNKYMLYSIIITTSVYVILTLVGFLTNNLNTIMAFVVIALLSIVVEFIYRSYKAVSIFRS